MLITGTVALLAISSTSSSGPVRKCRGGGDKFGSVRPHARAHLEPETRTVGAVVRARPVRGVRARAHGVGLGCSPAPGGAALVGGAFGGSGGCFGMPRADFAQRDADYPAGAREALARPDEIEWRRLQRDLGPDRVCAVD